MFDLTAETETIQMPSFFKLVKGKAIPVTSRETSRNPHYLDNRLTDGSDVEFRHH
jgi:hypothetical protein